MEGFREDIFYNLKGVFYLTHEHIKHLKLQPFLCFKKFYYLIFSRNKHDSSNILASLQSKPCFWPYLGSPTRFSSTSSSSYGVPSPNMASFLSRHNLSSTPMGKATNGKSSAVFLVFLFNIFSLNAFVPNNMFLFRPFCEGNSPPRVVL